VNEKLQNFVSYDLEGNCFMLWSEAAKVTCKFHRLILFQLLNLYEVLRKICFSVSLVLLWETDDALPVAGAVSSWCAFSSRHPEVLAGVRPVKLAAC